MTDEQAEAIGNKIKRLVGLMSCVSIKQDVCVVKEQTEKNQRREVRLQKWSSKFFRCIQQELGKLEKAAAND